MEIKTNNTSYQISDLGLPTKNEKSEMYIQSNLLHLRIHAAVILIYSLLNNLVQYSVQSSCS